MNVLSLKVETRPYSSHGNTIPSKQPDSKQTPVPTSWSVPCLFTLRRHFINRLYSHELQSVDAQPHNAKFRALSENEDETPATTTTRHTGVSYKYRKPQQSFLDLDDILVEPFGSQPSVYTSEGDSVPGYR